MRVSHRNIYANMLTYMNHSLTGLVELNLKASSQKEINRPSDNPIGMTRVLSYRDSLKSMEQYRNNIDTAQGWLGLADENLMQVSTIVTRLKELAQQGATGTFSGDNREQISYEARQLYQQLIMLSNASYEGKYIYSGHKTDTPAFKEALFGQSNDGSINSEDIQNISGGPSGTILVQFLEDGEIGSVPLEYRYSNNGGKTWADGILPASANPDDPVVMDLGGVQVTLAAGSEVAATAEDDYNDTSGTWLWVRPTAVYQGDDENGVDVEYFGAVGGLSTDATGVFRSNIMVRIDAVGASIGYSYSSDGGQNWTTGNTVPAGPPASLSVPGGFLEVDPLPAQGDQFVIRPNRALMHVEISQNETIQMNNIGKDVFGGLYNDQPVDLGKPGSNLFETVGKLIGYLETNTQQGAQQALEELTAAHTHITTYLAGVGARENRLALTDSVLYGLQLNAQERKSKIEDVDVADLMTKMAMQQITYEAVLKSSSTIMRMSLVNYL
ncbi:MAG TPA: flagellar hook-associated protein 3 [Desulfonatronum sp.]|nr:flagellar hook-associated protein 3 [Desulfonatronum sp.]